MGMTAAAMNWSGEALAWSGDEALQEAPARGSKARVAGRIGSSWAENRRQQLGLQVAGASGSWGFGVTES